MSSIDEPDDLHAMVEGLREQRGKLAKPLSAYFADRLGVEAEDIAVKVVSDRRQFGNRIGEVRKLRPRLLVTVLPEDADASTTDYYIRPELDPNRAIPAAITCRRGQDGQWVVDGFVEWDTGDLASRVRRAFPSANILEPVPAVLDQARRSTHAGDPPPWPDAEAIAEAAADLLVDESWLSEVLWLLRDRRSLVFYGPPGTGKTFIAQRIARLLQADPKLRPLIQLHPSYAYEDFFEGYRPVEADDGAPRLEKVPGPLRRLVNQMGNTQRGVLTLDEMNRGNLPKVFGELFFLLEYRKSAARLMYSPAETFRLPEDLYLIGTMNTADRSIAMLDQALRRRFHFVGLFPGEAPVDGIFERFLTEHHPSMLWVRDVLGQANSRLGNRHTAIGPTHFMRSTLDDDIVRRIWRYSVMPTIEDQFFDDPDQLAEFDIERLRAATTIAPMPPDGMPGVDE